MSTRNGKTTPRRKGTICFICGLMQHCQKPQSERYGCKDFVEDCGECEHSVTVNGKLYIHPKECFACARSPLPESGEVNDNFKRRK